MDTDAILSGHQPGTSKPRAPLSRQKAILCVSLTSIAETLKHQLSHREHRTEHLLFLTVQKQIDDAADVVTGLMDEINERLFLPTAIADITGISTHLTSLYICGLASSGRSYP